MGMGKTLEVIGVILAGIRRDIAKAREKGNGQSKGKRRAQALVDVKAQTNLMLVPESIVQQTADEFERHAPQLKVLVLPVPADLKVNANIMVAKAKYTARNDQELPLAAGDVVIVTSIIDPHWCRGRTQDETRDRFIPRNRLAAFRTSIKVPTNMMICARCNGVGKTYGGWKTTANMSTPTSQATCTWCCGKTPCAACGHSHTDAIVSGYGTNPCCRPGVMAHDDAARIMTEHDVVIAAHGSLLTPSAHAVFLRGLKSMHWRRVIVDECQFMLDRLDRKNANGQAGAYETRLFNGIKVLRRDFFYAVSGTPIAGDLHKGCANLLKLYDIDPYSREMSSTQNSFWQHSIEKPFERREIEAAIRVVTIFSKLLIRHSKTYTPVPPKEETFVNIADGELPEHEKGGYVAIQGLLASHILKPMDDLSMPATATARTAELNASLALALKAASGITNCSFTDINKMLGKEAEWREAREVITAKATADAIRAQSHAQLKPLTDKRDELDKQRKEIQMFIRVEDAFKRTTPYGQTQASEGQGAADAWAKLQAAEFLTNPATRPQQTSMTPVVLPWDGTTVRMVPMQCRGRKTDDSSKPGWASKKDKAARHRLVDELCQALATARQQPAGPAKRKVTAASLPMIMVATSRYPAKGKKKSDGKLAMAEGHILLVEAEDPADPASWFSGRKVNGKMSEVEAQKISRECVKPIAAEDLKVLVHKKIRIVIKDAKGDGKGGASTIVYTANAKPAVGTDADLRALEAKLAALAVKIEPLRQAARDIRQSEYLKSSGDMLQPRVCPDSSEMKQIAVMSSVARRVVKTLANRDFWTAVAGASAGSTGFTVDDADPVHQLYKDAVGCFVCQEVPIRPVVTSCGTPYCLLCLENVYKKSHDKKSRAQRKADGGETLDDSEVQCAHCRESVLCFPVKAPLSPNPDADAAGPAMEVDLLPDIDPGLVSGLAHSRQMIEFDLRKDHPGQTMFELEKTQPKAGSEEFRFEPNFIEVKLVTPRPCWSTNATSRVLAESEYTTQVGQSASGTPVGMLMFTDQKGPGSAGTLVVTRRCQLYPHAETDGSLDRYPPLPKHFPGALGLLVDRARYGQEQLTPHKAAEACKIIKVCLAKNPADRFIVASQFPEVTQSIVYAVGRLMDELFGDRDGRLLAVLHDTPKEERERAFAEHQRAGTACVVLIMASQKNFAGVNLNASNRIVLVDPPLTSEAEQQLIGRVHRLGQKNPVFVHHLVLKDSAEARLRDSWSGGSGEGEPDADSAAVDVFSEAATSVTAMRELGFIISGNRQ